MMEEWNKLVIRKDKEFEKIVKFHDQIIKSSISQKARGDQSFNDQTDEMKSILSIPSNKFLDWAKSLDMFIKTVINSKVNDMELINKYKEFVKELVLYQSQNDEITQKLQEFNQDYDMFTNIIIRLENKITQIKMSSNSIDDKIKNLQNQLRDAQETISAQADKIDDLEQELEEEQSKKKHSTAAMFDELESEDSDDDSDEALDQEEETEQAWNNILADEAPSPKKYEASRKEVEEYEEESDQEDDDSESEDDDSEDDSPEENTYNNDIDNDEVKKKNQPKREVKIIKNKFAYTSKNLKLFYFVHELGVCFTLTSLLKDANDKKIHDEDYSKSGVWRFLQSAVKAGDIYEFEPTANKHGPGSVYYSSKQKPDDLPHPFVMSERSLEVIKQNTEIFENAKK